MTFPEAARLRVPRSRVQIPGLSRVGVLLLLLSATVSAQARGQSQSSWTFAVSGDSRNCGDVIMPAIAQGAWHNRAAFYWHLGDLRRTSDPDEDIQHEPAHRARPLQKPEYQQIEWQDFIEQQIKPFGTMPFFVGIGNHETIAPKDRLLFIAQFADWLDTPLLERQRLRDSRDDHLVKTYFHWRVRGVDFLYLDNSTHEQFDAAQVHWFEGVLSRAERDPSTFAIVVGMHAALPESLAKGHSMSDWDDGERSGEQVYRDLLQAQDKFHKRVYILASHSHFYMSGIFNSPYWRAHGGVLPGWIIGTAGAVRYRLPEGAREARESRTDTYGYLLARVRPRSVSSITFEFQTIRESDIPHTVSASFTPEFVHNCFVANRQNR